MTNASRINEEQDMLAAELAFGLLDGVDRERAQSMRDDDPDFAAAVRRWESQAVAEMATLQPIAPPTALWNRIAAATSPVDNVVPFDAAAVQDRLARRLALWRKSALVGGALAAGLALLLVVRTEAPLADTTRIAAADPALATVQIVGSDEKPIATAVFDRSAGTMRVKLDVEGNPDLVPEFWVIPADGTPRSLGRRARGTVKLTPQQQRLVFAGGAFAVSLEPDDGVVSASPRGQVLGAGAIQLL